MINRRSVLAGLEEMHNQLGDVFQITLPGFDPVVMVGPEYNRHVLVSGRDMFRWRNERDPVTRLLRHGLLVEDGERHDSIKATMEPAMSRSRAVGQIDEMVRLTDGITAEWGDGQVEDMLVEMRRLALVILFGSLFSVDFSGDLDEMWDPILKSIEYISPGLWILSPDVPRLGYQKKLQKLDDYLFDLIEKRRVEGSSADDLLSLLVADPEMTPDLIRDQLLTMMIAGHDTSTALLAWALYLLGKHPEALQRAREEVTQVLGQDSPAAHHLSKLQYLEQVIKETIRLYPPIHVGNRVTAKDHDLAEYHLPEGQRIMYSIYLSHRDPKYWTEPDAFQPERFDRQQHNARPSFSYLPFGGGPRHCIGAAFAQIEAKIVLARILQTFDLSLTPQRVTPHMGATLEPRPGVFMRVSRRVAHD